MCFCDLLVGRCSGAASSRSAVCGQQWAFVVAPAALEAAGYKRERIAPELHALQKPIAQGRLVSASALVPKLVRALFGLLLHMQVVIHCEKGRRLNCCWDSLLHLASPAPAWFCEDDGFVTVAALRISFTIDPERFPPVGKTVCR